MSKIQIEIGQKFGQLTVYKELPTLRLPGGQTNRVFLMRCDCGKEKAIRLLHFIRGRITTCGHARHGDTGKSLHNIWRGMRNRCRENYFQSKYYGEKNISVCEEWQNSYEAFRGWAYKNGYKNGLTIDRKNGLLGYSADNCRFVTQRENNANRANTFFVVYKNKKLSLAAVLHKKKLIYHYRTIFNRIKRGWDSDAAIDTPVKKGNYRRGKRI